jgi:asparagine synthase (glutamine-hydrolysing)
VNQLVFLNNNITFSWQEKNGFWLKTNKQDNHVVSIPNSPLFQDALDFYNNESTGFTWVFQDENKVVCSVDIIRSFPLFYYWDGISFFVSDDVNYLKENFSPTVNPSQIEPFSILGHTLGNQTLLNNVYVLLPQQYLTYNIQSNILEIKSFSKKNSLVLDNKEASFLKMTDDVFDDLIKNLNNNTAIIPLSGGMDSRFILSALYQKGYRNIICYTYGKKNSFEVTTAQKICTALNVKWFFVEYNVEIFQSYLNEQAWKYEVFASQFTSIAHEQDYFALLELKKKNLIPDDGIIIPGFCADFPAGSTVPLITKRSKIEFSFDGLVNFILDKYFFTSPKKANSQLINQLRESIEIKNITSFEEWMEAYDLWFLENKVSKFVNNAIRCFEFLGHRWELPFWDKRFIDFWEGVPLEQKVNRRFYKEMLLKHFFTPLGIGFNMSTADEDLAESKLFTAVKNIVPKNFKNIGKNILLNKSELDVNSLSHFGNLLGNDIGLSKAAQSKFKNENQAHAAWFLKKNNLVK